jgi:hypothetical protein
MNGQTDFTVKADPEDFKNTLFLAMELSRASWLVATFAPRLGDKISVHTIPGGDTKRLLDLIGRKAAAWFTRQRPKKRMRDGSIVSGSDWCVSAPAT